MRDSEIKKDMVLVSGMIEKTEAHNGVMPLWNCVWGGALGRPEYKHFPIPAVAAQARRCLYL
jgi:hypothetical protein